MKIITKFIYLITSLFICGLIYASCVSCSNELDSYNNEQPSRQYTPSTVCSINGVETRVNSVEHSDYNIEDAYFYIRVDNRIPGSGSYPVNEYYPRKNTGGSPRMEYNHGQVNVNYVGWSVSDNIPTKYIYDTTGKTTILPLISQPDLKNLLINSNVNLNTDTLKVIWYITKYESGFWHVDGVLTGKSTKDVTEVPGIDEDTSKENKKEDVIAPELNDSIVIDIHQQEHQTWDEIKTSIHIRDLVDSIKIRIPIESKFVCESDDMAIRYYEYFDTAEQSYSYVKIQVKYDSSSIDITIKVNPNYVKELIDKGSDGLTVELHNYTKGLSKEEVYELIKQPSVTTYKETKVVGKISSAYFDDIVLINH